MKCINRSIKRMLAAILIPALFSVSLLTGCAQNGDIALPYDKDTTNNSFRFESNDTYNTAAAFAEDLCIPEGDSSSANEIEAGADSYGSAAFFDIKNKKTMYSKNVYARLYPASLTKVMTALVAIENCDMDKILTADESCVLTEDDVQKIGLKAGDTMTLDQALHFLLIYSANDVANLIAVNVGGSIDGFAVLMNERAKKLGATNTNFVNPSGLHDDNHYTSSYDMYLMFNEAIKYGKFIEIIGMSEYSTVYKNMAGDSVEFSCTSTNRYFRGQVNAPTQVNIIGGKTGTTMLAGANLILLSKDSSGNSYISVVMRAKNADVLYEKTNSMLTMLT
ncbi:MAG: D-alanyl-D-alanine carboxypeptidase [Lachnospiraceae bacterium]|nr:D-alanyl-D-alanine carboxypeptidase [Lachnospiraceae bacterium]